MAPVDCFKKNRSKENAGQTEPGTLLLDLVNATFFFLVFLRFSEIASVDEVHCLLGHFLENCMS